MPNDILKNINAFIDGRGFAGEVKEYTPPKLTAKLMEYNAGGMSAPIDVAMGAHEKLEAEITICGQSPEVLKGFGLVEGGDIPFNLRAVTEDDDGATHGVEIALTGKIKELDQGSWKPGEEASLKVSLTLSYYRYARDGATLIELDPRNMVAVIDGVDQLADQRTALGL